MKLLQIYETILKETNISEDISTKLNVEGNSALLYHYSNQLIEDDYLKVRSKQQAHSASEYRAWGRGRLFFYGKKDGVNYDKGVSSQYLYLTKIPLKKIYDINKNPNNYEPEEGVTEYESLFEQSFKDGYTAWFYYLGGNKKVPIVVSFVDVPILKKLKKNPSGEYVDVGEEQIDFPIGTIEIDGEKWIIMQQFGYLARLNNTYLTQEEDPKEAMESYKRPFYQYEWKGVKLFDEFKNKYKLK
jgi:hypothetical protein